jgi:PTS system fructose-specific IIC component
MIALAFLLDTIMGYGDVGGSFGSATPISAFLKYVGGLAMGLMVPVLAGYIAYSIADRPGLAVGFAGGLLATNGNAAIADYNWDNVSGFAAFVKNFAFVGEGSGNTVSGFLGGIAAGFLAGFVVLWLKKITKNLPESLEGIKPTLIYPLGGVFIVGVVMCFILNPLIGLVNTGLSVMLTAISDSGMIWLMGLLLGAMMAIDMGGPINKAAYVFGTGMLAQAATYVADGAAQNAPEVTACYIAMASVMVGGMVPPLGIALACWFFPKKFTEAERETKVSNVVMAMSFITEGAIPFAAADPGRVIPCTLVGAGVAGMLSAIFGCTLMAPHGGVFVFATVGKPLLYIVSWLIGSAITCFMLGMLKKDADQM